MKFHGLFVAAFAAMKSIGKANGEEVAPSFYNPNDFYNPNERRESFDLVMKPYPIPVEDTTYVDVIFNLPEDIPDLIHIVMGELINSQPLHLHHFVLDGCTEKIDESMEGIPIPFDALNREANSCIFTNFGAWAKGGNIFNNIDLDAGVLIGKGMGIKSIRMNVHYTDGVYEDPEAKTFKMATDGFRVHYTPDFRPYTAQSKNVIGVITANDKLVVPANESRFFVTKTCKVNTSCKDFTPEMIRGVTSYFGRETLAAGGITCQEAKQYCNDDSDFGAYVQRLCPDTCGLCGDLEGRVNPYNPGSYRVTGVNYHAHLLGREMYTTLIRVDQNSSLDTEIVVKDMQSKPFWIYDFQETYALDFEDIVSSDGTNNILRGFEIKPGDKIQATCVYDGTDRANDTKFGLPTTEEMCIISVVVSVETPGSLLNPIVNSSSIETHDIFLRNFFCDSDEESDIYTGILAEGEDGREIWKNHPISTAEGCVFPSEDWTVDLSRGKPPICPNNDTGDMNSDNEDSNDLFFEPFEPYFPCADGSPAGIYREGNPNATSATDHIIVFLGGGVCTSEENCKELMEKSPFLFSSDFLPKSLQGQTLFSRNATDNIVSSNFTRWIVPYCTQDLFLGSNRFAVKWGSGIFEAALTTLENSFKDSSPNTLIVAGISAGAIGLMNHMESVQKLSRAANVTKLRVILDSVSIASTTETAREMHSALEEITDFEKLPLCSSSYTMAFQPMEIWNIPCCVSVHCMLENDPVLQRFTQADTDDGKERLLILDSLYDLLAIPMQLSNASSISDLDSFATRIFEIGGARAQQFSQSAFGSLTRLGGSVLWAVTNTAAHTFLLPALEIEQLRCGDNAGGLEVYGSNEYVCKEDGVGIRGELIDGLNLTAWLTTEAWQLVTVNGESIGNIIHDFVYNETITHGLVQDVCSGPNCVPTGATEPNPAQKLFVLNDEFTSISLLSEILLLVTAGCLVLTYGLRALKVDLNESSSEKEDTDGKSGEEVININHLSVLVQDTGKELLNDVSFSLPPGSITAIIGPSGAGKSTLLNVLCGQLPDGLQGSQRDKPFGSLDLQTSYLRQFGNTSFQNIELMAYLKLTAKLYGASKSELEMILVFLRKSFADRVGTGPNFDGIRIKELSGGQQRTVAIASTMLTKPKLLLLDEPLSGLDSFSAMLTLGFIRDLAKERSCAILLSLHQPSDAILEQIDKSLLLHGGNLVMNQKITSSIMIHDVLERLADGEGLMCFESMRRGSIRDSMNQQESDTESGNSCEFNNHLVPESEKPTTKICPSSFSISRKKFYFWQIQLLMRRLQLEIGHDYRKMFELAVSYAVICGLLQFKERRGPVEIIIAISLFCCVPVFIFQPLLLRACISYNNHRYELQDGRISPLAYMLGSFCFSTSMPVAAIASGIAIGYGLLGWDFGTYPDQFLLASLFFLVTHQLGRVILVFMDGVYPKVDFVYVCYTALSLVLSGLMVPPSELPVYIRWLSFLSVGWWSISGTMLVHLEQGNLFDESDICSSLQSCILQDGVFLAHYLGFKPIGSTRLSYVVLLSMFVVLFATEFGLMVRKYGSTKRRF